MPKPTMDEQIKALYTLRVFVTLVKAETSPLEIDVKAVEAFELLDRADIFADIDDEIGAREAMVDRTPVAIVKLRPTLFQAQGADGRVWATGTGYAQVEQRLEESDAWFIIVSPEELSA